MYWVLCFIISALCFMISVFFAFMRMRSKYKSGRLFDITKILLIGTVVSSVVLFIPIYRNAFKSTDCGLFETVFLSIHNMIRLFVVDGDFGFITDNIASQADWIQRAYSVLFAILFVMAPVLTFGFVMSFFKNAFAHLKYIANYNSDIFVFSELNERSLALARSLSDKPERRLFVFTDVFEKENEQSFELFNGAKELGAICFKKDILAIDFSLHSKHSEINFFAIGEDQTENISQTLKIASDYRYRENTNLYLFDSGIESEILIVNAFEDDNDRTPAIKIRRVNEVQSLVNRNLYECGYEKIFKSARDKSECKKISAVIIGMGQHGTEMTKALSWFCQMDGYETEINAFDIKENAAEHFKSQCPELMDDRYNGRFDTDGEAKYKITVHSGIDADTLSFDNMMLSMTDATYVFVALGSDDKNIACAIKPAHCLRETALRPLFRPWSMIPIKRTLLQA